MYPVMLPVPPKVPLIVICWFTVNVTPERAQEKVPAVPVIVTPVSGPKLLGKVPYSTGVLTLDVI